MGDYVIRKLKSNQVNAQYVRKSETAPTSVIFVSKSTETPDFIPYRQADCEIFESQLPDEIIAQAKIFHTTCFALSKNPARETILNRAKKAAELGVKLSIDINFSERIWPDRTEAKKVLKEYTDKEHLLEGNKKYAIKIVVDNGLVQYFINEILFWEFKDAAPYTEGYFGFRTTTSHQTFENFKVYKLK